MAQLKDTVVTGNIRVTNEVLANSVQTSTIKIPTTSGSTTLGPGTAGQVIKSDGTGAYWAADSNTTYSAGTGITISGNSNAINVTYGTSANTACQGNDSRLSDARTPTAHNQASNTINAMTGYSAPSNYSAITTSDTLNGAIGKLEAAIGDIDAILEAVL